MLSNKKLFLILIISGFVFSLGNITSNVYGHGITSEILQSETLDGQGVSLNLYSTTSPTDQKHREIFFELIDSETDELLNEVTFLIKVSQNEKTIFENSFQADEGFLILDMDMINYSFSNVEQRDSEFDDPNKLKKAKMKNIPNLLSSEVPGGLYEFEITVITTGSYSNELDEPIVFESGLSFPSSEFFVINDSNYGMQEFGLIGYYDKSYDFNYDPETRAITFSMPYSWPEHTKEDKFFVHNEILIPKSFGDLRYENFSAYVNGIDQTESVFNIDFALEKYLQVHLVTQWEQFKELSKKLEDKNGNRPSVLEYLFVPTDPDAPFSSLTHGGRYRINLSWEPEEITSGSETTFFVELLDIYTKDKPIPTEYHFTIIHDDEEIFHKSGVSTDPVTKTTKLKFQVPEDVSGPITIRFENLGGGIFSNLDFPLVVNRINNVSEEISIPDNVSVTPPRKQIAQGVLPNEIICKEGLELIIKYNGFPVCVKPTTVEKLIERGWALETSSIESFEECVAAGNPVMESYPRQCRTPDGKHFVESLPDQERCEITGGLWGIWSNHPSAIASCNLSTSDAGKECTDSTQCQSFCQAKDGAEISTEDTGTCYGYELAICMQEVRNGVVEPEWCQ